MLSQVIVGFIQLINMLILIWCVLSWFPNIRWYDQPFKLLDQLVQPIIAPFRKIIPPVANFDLSPMVALFALQLIQMLVLRLLP